MRFLSLALCLSIGVPSFAKTVSYTVPADRELWQSLTDLNKRSRVARTGHFAAQGFKASFFASLITLPAALLSHGKNPTVFRGVSTVAAASWVASIWFLSMELGAVLVDRLEFEKGRRTYGKDDPEQRAARAVLAIDDFFMRDIYEQYVMGSENTQVRGYIIQLDQWIKNGAANAPAPQAFFPQ